MKPNHQKLLNEGLDLPPEARAALAGHLLEGLDDAVDEDAAAAWRTDIARRLDDSDQGKVKTAPWPVALRQVRCHVRRPERRYKIGCKR